MVVTPQGDNEIEEIQLTREALVEIYTPIGEAKDEILNRWNDTVLRDIASNALAGEVPAPFLGNSPQAVLFRYVATPNFEFGLAARKSDILGLPLLYIEFTKDKFCTINPEKRSLGRMSILNGVDKHGNYIVAKKNIFDLATNDGKRFCDITTFSGESLVDLHHRMFFAENKNIVYDISDFAAKSGRCAIETYPFYLTLFTTFGVLFEDYDVSSKEERRFVLDVVLPAFRSVRDMFGVKPLIVQLLDSDQGVEYWNFYPKEIKEKYGI